MEGLGLYGLFLIALIGFIVFLSSVSVIRYTYKHEKPWVYFMSVVGFFFTNYLVYTMASSWWLMIWSNL